MAVFETDINKIVNDIVKMATGAVDFTANSLGYLDILARGAPVQDLKRGTTKRQFTLKNIIGQERPAPTAAQEVITSTSRKDRPVANMFAKAKGLPLEQEDEPFLALSRNISKPFIYAVAAGTNRRQFLEESFENSPRVHALRAFLEQAGREGKKLGNISKDSLELKKITDEYMELRAKSKKQGGLEALDALRYEELRKRMVEIDKATEDNIFNKSE